MIEIVTVTPELVRSEAPLYHNRPNQLRRKLGAFEEVYTGDRCGTVRVKHSGEYFDWWLSDTLQAAPGWPLVLVIPAK